MSDLPNSLSLSLLLFPFLFFLISVAGQSNDKRYPHCPSYGCGYINISYPFWRIGSETNTQFCGHPGFGVNCSYEDGRLPIPSINLGNDSYYIRNIAYDSNSTVIVDYDVSAVAPPDDCPRVRHNISIETLPLAFVERTVNLSFHFNCNGVPEFSTEIPCLSPGANKSCVNDVRSKPPDFSWDSYSCQDHVETTVFGGFALRPENIQWAEITDALKRGFELRWGRTEECEKCEESDGRCGYNHNQDTEESESEFMCFCPGGTITMDHCKGSRANWKIKLAVGVVSGFFGVFLMGAICLFWRKRHIKKRYYGSSYMSRNINSYPSSITDPEKNETYHGVQIFKYKELEKATNYFDAKKELGDGGFGTVYHGKLKDGREVAVKRLYENNYKRVEQFMNEVSLLAHLRHRNLVSLYGCTTHHSRELLLVYEYIPNGTVADHLHGEKSNPGSLPWSTRIHIATETASALVYLHASDVVHRDVKTNNILLDNSFSVKVADFGLSRLFPTDVTHVSTAPQGTPGYVDPEYHECYQLTSKSDVYSFGVVLIELISSKPAVDITRHRQEINLSNMALNKIRNDALGELVDPSLGFETDYEVRKMITAVAELAFRCLQNERESRPTMEEVLEYLISIQNGGYNKEKGDHVLDDDSLSLKDHSQTMSPDSVAIAWSTSTLSTSGG